MHFEGLHMPADSDDKERQVLLKQAAQMRALAAETKTGPPQALYTLIAESYEKLADALRQQGFGAEV